MSSASRKFAAMLLASLLVFPAGMVLAEQAVSGGSSVEQRIQDAWIQGKLESAYALNRHLNPFRIDTDVVEGVVRLKGSVESDIDRDLAGEIAKGVRGVRDVDNELTVDARAGREAGRQRGDRDFAQWIDDATTTASVKSKLLANRNTRGLDIDVDTRADVVTLSGMVGSDEERQLAEELARNTGDVADVHNELRIASTD